jgi:hypothetical protein
VAGHFLLVARTNAPFRYRVSVVREGGGYAQRRVDVTQRREAEPEQAGGRTSSATVTTPGKPAAGDEGPLVFTCVCSFKTDEASVVARSKRADLEREYAVVLAGRAPESWPEAPGIDSPLWVLFPLSTKPGPTQD